jgi:hypothetical protein
MELAWEVNPPSYTLVLIKTSQANHSTNHKDSSHTFLPPKDWEDDLSSQEYCMEDFSQPNNGLPKWKIGHFIPNEDEILRYEIFYE